MSIDVDLRPRVLRPIASEVSSHASASVCDVDGRNVTWVRLGDVSTPAPIGPAEAVSVCRGIDEARSNGVPIVFEIGGATVSPDAGLMGLDAWGRIARSLAMASGVVPVVAIITGPVVTGVALVLGMCDVVVMTSDAGAYVSGPAAVLTTTGRDLEAADLGGSDVHGTISGVAHLVAADLDHAIAMVVDLLAHLPSNNLDPPPRLATVDDAERWCHRIESLVPSDVRLGYDVRAVVTEIIDDGELLELSQSFGRAIVCGLARLDGIAVGVIANQPAHLAGAIDIESSQKAARMIQWCDAFGLPLVTFVDTPGYLPGRDLEWEGMIRFGGQLAFAYAAATVPRLCVLMRKAYGGAYIVMDCKTMGNDLCVAWPDAEIAVMGAAGAVQILHSRQLSSLDPDDAIDVRATLEADYAARHLHPHEAAQRGYVDAVIEPGATRSALTRALPGLLGKRPGRVDRKHHNGPL